MHGQLIEMQNEQRPWIYMDTTIFLSNLAKHNGIWLVHICHVASRAFLLSGMHDASGRRFGIRHLFAVVFHQFGARNVTAGGKAIHISPAILGCSYCLVPRPIIHVEFREEGFDIRNQR
jgi:hypothetical protein